jgi:anti-sigma regulatory factor (Ser/Thr protein kinase)
MPADLVLDVAATTAGLRSVQDAILASCTRSKLPRDTISRLQIAIEELFSNTIKYGYGGECERPVRIRLQCAPRVELVYEDAAPPFDPTAWRETHPPAGGVGRKGIVLVLGLAQSVRYQKLRDGNRLTLGFITPASGAP